MVFKKKEWRPFEEAREFARSLNLRNAVEWRQYCKSGKDGVPKSNDIPSAPDVIYKNDWNGWFDWLGNEDRVSALKGRKMPERTEEHRRKIGEALKGRKRTEEHKKKMSEAKKKSWRPFEEAREFTRSLNLRGSEEWFQYCKSGKDGKPRPDDIPSNPDKAYKNNGWKDWVDWLGNEELA